MYIKESAISVITGSDIPLRHTTTNDYNRYITKTHTYLPLSADELKDVYMDFVVAGGNVDYDPNVKDIMITFLNDDEENGKRTAHVTLYCLRGERKVSPDGEDVD